MRMLARAGFVLSLPVLFALFFLLPVLAQAQNREAPDRLTPRLRVNEAEEPVRLVSLAVHTEIQSGFAESSLDMEFYNPNGRVLEGELEFPLNPGQEISGLALDIAGELRRGVPISKARGQEVFDNVIRQKVDPALLEATRGNAYRLRVYPLPANGKRRVVVRVMQPLEAENGNLHYRLPLTFAETLDSVSIETVIVSPAGEVKAEAGNLGLRLERTGAIFRGRAEGRNISPEGWLDITLPAPEAATPAVSAVRWGGKLYFSAAAHINVPDKARALPKLVTIVWDASGSGRERRTDKEFTLLDSYFQAFESGEARLVVLRDKAEPPQKFKIKKGDWAELKAAVHGLVYDGATNLTDWTPTDDCREYLLFSDGLANFRSSSGPNAFPQLAPTQRLFAINSAAAADYAALRGLAAGGAVIDLAHETAELAAAKLLREGARISFDGAALAGAAEAAPGPESAYLMSAGGRGGMVRLAGWVKRGGGVRDVPLQLALPGGGSRKINVALPAWNETPEIRDEEAPLPARLWGRYAIAGLEADYRTNKKAIARLGEEFGVISRETSLIVLETARDYALYGVKPPASLKAEVEAISLSGEEAAGGEKIIPAERLAAMWGEKVKWWERSFDSKPKDPKADEINPELATESGADRYTIEQDFDWGVYDRQGGGSTLDSNRPYWDVGDAVPGDAMPYWDVGDAISGDVMPQAAPAGSALPRGETNSNKAVGMRLKPWVSDAPYIARMKEAKDDELYAVYLDERPDYLNSSAFFIDVADRFFERGLKELGLRVLSNLAEMELENRQILRMLAYRLMQAGEMAMALPVLEQVRDLAPYEPHSLRDIATVQAALGRSQEAVDLLYETARRQWSPRFGEINTIALTEMNALIAAGGKEIDTAAIDSGLIKNLASDIRVVLSWDMDNTDMDLWVTAPDGEAAYYGHRLTRIGGRMTSDCTQGYGPEEFMLKKAIPGTYRVEVKYYGHSRQTIAGEVTMLVTIFSKFGTPQQKVEQSTLRLKNVEDKILIAEFTVE